MPLFIISTNLPRSAIPDNFLSDASTLFQQRIDKPMQYITVRINPDQMMTFADTTDPCAHVDVKSIGKISPELNRGYTRVLTEFICSKLGIKDTRMAICFTNLEPANVGFTGKTLEEIMAGR